MLRIHMRARTDDFPRNIASLQMIMMMMMMMSATSVLDAFTCNHTCPIFPDTSSESKVPVKTLRPARPSWLFEKQKKKK